jgi:hypothetical protein
VKILDGRNWGHKPPVGKGLRKMETRQIWKIAVEIRQAMFEYKQTKGHIPSWWYYAENYVEAMESLITIDDMYYADTAKSVVSYALANLGTWRGEKARAIKAELRAML